tara:strand:+ start:37 stop:465 length:429 start_codon:yes stop_codon:yes gene_type:complete
MAKDLPFFRFNVSEWLTGNIAYESYELQGLFIKVCCEYWNRENSITIKEIKKRTKEDKNIDYLIENNFLIKKRNKIKIKFLDEEKSIILDKLNKRREAGRKGGLSKARAMLKHKDKDIDIDIDNIKNKKKIRHWNKDLPTGI